MKSLQLSALGPVDGVGWVHDRVGLFSLPSKCPETFQVIELSAGLDRIGVTLVATPVPLRYQLLDMVCCYC